MKDCTVADGRASGVHLKCSESGAPVEEDQKSLVALLHLPCCKGGAGDEDVSGWACV